MNRFFSRRAKGFTMIELLIVVLIIAILVAVLLPVLAEMRRRARDAQAKQTMQALSTAMECYRNDFKAYPPQDEPERNGSAVIWYHLCRRHTVGDMKYGPYLEAKEDQLKTDSADIRRFVSPHGGDYYYALMKDAVDHDGYVAERRYIIVDPGPDQQIAGGIAVDDTGSEFFKATKQEDGTRNFDADNIYSNDATAQQ